MQQPTFFENEIVQPKNLDFLNDSTAKNIKDVVVAIGQGKAGIVSGLTLSGVSGNNFYTVTSGYGFDGNGERVQIYSGTNIGIDFTGTKAIYLNVASAVYNPDPSENPLGALNVVTNVDPTDSSLVAVENYNIGTITQTSGSTYIPLGTVSADSSMLLVSTSASGSRNFLIGGIIDLNTSTINGLNIGSGTIDSNIFTSQLHYDINLASGTDIILIGSGNNNIGSQTNPLANIYAMTGNFHQLVGFSPILVDTLWQVTGTSLEATGTNLVKIDNNQLGTQFGRGLTLNTDSISTLGLNKDINVSTDPLKRINLSASVNITAGNNLYVKDNLYVSGTAVFSNTNITSVTGNFGVAGAISYNSTTEGFDNQVRNSNFAVPSGNITGTVTYPANWNVTMYNTDYAYGPLTNPNEYAFSSVALNNAMNIMGTTGNYTIEANVKKFGNSLFGDNINQIWTKFSNIPTNGGNFYIKTNGALSFFQNGVELAGPASIINNQWYHVAYTWNGTQRKIWLDGVNVATDSTVGNFVITTTQSIAAFGANSRNFNGLVNNLRFSNIARTSFPSGSAAPSTGADSSTFGYWRFNNNLLDSSVNGFTLNQNPAGITGTFSDTGLGQVFSGTIAGTGNDTSLSPLTQNVYVGPPHTTNWLLASGTNIDPTGVYITQALPDIKLNTPYNLSYFWKGFSNFSGINILPSISGTTASGTPSITALSTSANIITNNDWTRQVASFTTPASGSNFNLSVGIASVSATGIISTGVFGLTAFQLTEGPAIVPYKPHERMQIISINSPTTFSVAVNAGVGANPLVPQFGRTFYTKGGYCVINASLVTQVNRTTAANSEDISYSPLLILDGKQVAGASHAIPYGMANTIPTGYTLSSNSPMTFSTYLNEGFHTLQLRLLISSGGGTNVGVWTYNVVGGDLSNIAITIFE